jgi:hypothetical protein
MLSHTAFRATATCLLAFLSIPALAAERVPLSVPPGKDLPVIKISSSSNFDRLCPAYFRSGNSQDVLPEFADAYCTCVAGNMDAQGLGDRQVLDFLGRVYSEDLTAFIDEYPKGEAWMEAFFAAEEQCKNQDYGSNEPPPQGNMTQIPAGSWGGVVREGPGQNYRKVTTLQQGERVMLIENTGVMWNDYPWWQIEYGANFSGYQWGGILCSLNAPMEGIYETCE